MRLLFFFLFTVWSLSAAQCQFKKPTEVSVEWTAYKTASKIGVHGGFRSVSYAGVMQADTLEKLLVGATVKLQTNNVDSQNPQRDAKLVQFFFNQMSGQMIEAKVLSLKGDAHSGNLMIDIILNGRGKVVPLHYTVEANIFSAQGVIDLNDFGALAALHSITVACYDLHEGKTWQDVSIGFTFEIQKRCR